MAKPNKTSQFRVKPTKTSHT